ncbi:ubiquitin-protein ligase-like protein [Polyplosphaeria fusca]|uniref:Ubiquitin-protein ligase-like protein n=1 Tax=Polyplosphaeria fusca TaxID=682080 RepID=A0A9P4V4G5_9PLEO|nr:ubiquitin-protein ligase-like protein [Polyplosphaeria fusca]
MEQPHSPLANVTAYLPSPADLLMVVPRLISRAGAYAEHIDSVFGRIRSGGSVIAEPTMINTTNATVAATSGTFVQESVAAAANTVSGNIEEMSIFQALKNFTSFFSYITSKWAITIFTMAILLNRTHFYASSRVPLSFDRLYLRLALYILPTLLFLYRIQSVLQALRCQTSPGWTELQYGAAGKQLDTDFAGEGGFLWQASSALLFWEDVETSCKAVGMLPEDPSVTRAKGSLALLWPLFLSLGFSQFVETLSCALQGRHPIQEVGMTIFEHSLAFAEAEAVVTKPLTVDSARFYKAKQVFTPSGDTLTISRTSLSQFVNVPPEVLLIALISSFSHLTSNVLAIVGLRARYRLITTGIWGFAYMSAFAWSFVRFATIAADPGQHVGILRFPTVCIVGFIPHLLILVGIAACGLIYLVAFGVTVLSPPPGQPAATWRERLSTAYGNLHANIHFSAITPLTVSWHEDFYTAILKVGFTVLTAASEAVFLNEGTRIRVESLTWVERKRLRDMVARRRQFRQTLTNVPRELRGDAMAEGVEVIDRNSLDAQSSGYARERKSQGAAANTDAARALGRANGVGLQQRRSRWILTYRFLRAISLLLMSVQAKLLISILRKMRIQYHPRWLQLLAGPQMSAKGPQPATGTFTSSQGPPEPWLVVDEKTSFRPSKHTDLEAFARERLRAGGYFEENGPDRTEEHLTDYLYNWWKRGGQWGEVDTSGEYSPQDDDNVSVTSFVTTTSANEWEDMDDGQRTPTQSWSFSGVRDLSRESTPVPDALVDLSRLSSLLNPQTEEDREEARFLSRHLQSTGILTRSQYRKLVEQDESRILRSSRHSFPDTAHMTPAEEERLLEEFILKRRDIKGAASAGTWDTGAEGMGAEGPQCVVCQLSPRTVLVWPCGCLSLCDECRVGLASKNYTTCVCCRTNVAAYSKLYVP